MKLQKLAVVISMVAALIFSLNCGKSEKKEADTSATEAPVDPALQKGKDQFSMNCASCHGDHGAGDGIAAASLNPKPRNFKAPAADWKNGNTEEGILKTINEGIPGTGMVSFKSLGADNVKEIAKYVRHLATAK
ncbi:MAG: cytochrome c [Leptospiraceae bacterium]|nr:cytochrome c [Leptospiraceae bacterium]MCK6381179.1 cytochrome c [Leptospiraceae bacterium]